MAVEINEELINILSEPTSIKMLASLDEKGNINLVAKGSISLSEDKTELIYFELIEASRTNKNLTGSLWFNRQVAVNVVSKDGISYQIHGTPVRAVVAGKEFENAYKRVIVRNPANDLAAVYHIRIDSVKNETYPVRLAEAQKKHPLYVHFDKLIKKSK